jgi:hypothetical protein
MAGKHHECSRGLIDLGCPVQVDIEATESPVHGISRPEPIYEQIFENKRLGRGKPPDIKPSLWNTAGVNKFASDSAGARLAAGLNHAVDTAA